MTDAEYKPQLIENLSFPEYLDSKAYGSSDIRDMATSFEYWKWKKSQPREETRSLVVGSTTHLMLEAVLTGNPQLMDARIKVFKEFSSRTKAFDKFSAENKAFLCVDECEYEMCQRMAAAVLAEPEAMEYMRGAIVEPTIFARYPGTNVLMKCRPDYLHSEKGISVNFKTSIDASRDGFIKACKEYSYDWQSGIYCDLLRETFKRQFDEIHVLVEKAEAGPCRVYVSGIGDDTLGFARTQYAQIIERIPECEKTNIWPKPTVVLDSIEVPLWARRTVNF